MKCEKWTDQLDTLVWRCYCDHTWWGAPHVEMLWFRNKTRVVANCANDWRPPHTWIPEGKRSRNWLKITFRKIVKTECKKRGLDWLKSVTWKIVKPWRIEDVTGQPYAPITRANRMSEYVCEADPSTSSYSTYSEPSGLKKHLQEKPMVTERLRNDPSHHQNDALRLA